MTPGDSSASSPFSNRSTQESSPEVMSPSEAAQLNQQKALLGQFFNHNIPLGHGALTQAELMQGMQGLFSGFQGLSPSSQQRSSASPPVQPPPASFSFDVKPSIPSTLLDSLSISQQSRDGKPRAHHGGTRSDPPLRAMEVSDVPVANVPFDEVVQSRHMNRLLLQGDPQVINKQRVETAIRVIIDLLRLIPPTPSSTPLNSSLTHLLLRDGAGNVLTSLERIGTFRTLRLQAGTTTKASSKKQIQAGPTPKNQLLYLETAAYMSGENGQRVYACKRCRAREAKRRQTKDAARKKPPAASVDGSSAAGSTADRRSNVTAPSPSPHYITGTNPEQYDPLKVDQMVQEPDWDPEHPDWRHEIVLFNSPPEMAVKDGSCFWLPFRIICYGKCHGEKIGFRVKFTLRAHNGAEIATAMTDPIRITDDHKTDAKAKPKVEAVPQPAIPRARKGRASVASSRRVSPAPSDAESVQSLSEAGAVLQRQTPSVRAGKPYQRPPSQSPLTGTMSMEQFSNPPAAPNDMPIYHRTQSSTSLASAAAGPSHIDFSQNISMSNLFERPANGTVSPGALRQPNFEFTPFNDYNSNVSSAPPSATSSNFASPISQTQSLDGDGYRFNSQSPSNIMDALNFSLSQSHQQMAQNNVPLPSMSAYSDNRADLEMSNAINSSFGNMFSNASTASTVSQTSYVDDASELTSSIPDASLYSDSGLPPDLAADEMNFLDFSGGEADHTRPLSQPNFPAGSPDMQAGLSLSPLVNNANLSDILASMAQHQHPMSPPMSQVFAQPAVPPPMIFAAHPNKGPIWGGTEVMIVGQNLRPDLVVMFGERAAVNLACQPTFMTCRAPPGAAATEVQVRFEGLLAPPGPPVPYSYITTQELAMELAGQLKAEKPADPAGYTVGNARFLASNSAFGSSQLGSPRGNTGPRNDNSLREAETAFVECLGPWDEASLADRESGWCDRTNGDGHTLLHLATVWGFKDLIRCLLQAQAGLEIQDINGYTPLALGCLMGKLDCVELLVESGASYDMLTPFGESPLDLAKIGKHKDVEGYLLSAVWSTTLEDETAESEEAVLSAEPAEVDHELDEDNPSDGSDDEGIDLAEILAIPLPKSRRTSLDITSRSERKSITPPRRAISTKSASPVRRSTASSSSTPYDEPPPYEETAGSSTSIIRHQAGQDKASSVYKIPVPETVFDRLPKSLAVLLGDKEMIQNGWVAVHVPTLQSLQWLRDPDQLQQVGQAWAVAALNAVVSTGATTSMSPSDNRRKKTESKRKRRAQANSLGDESSSGSTSSKTSIGTQMKRDRMLYLFWLPILVFVGFWAFITLLPVITGISFIYCRQISRAVKNRIYG